MKVIKLNKGKEFIKIALAVLRKGGLVIYPTETCYGIGGDVTNLEAIKKVLEFKGNRGGKPISIAVADQKMAGTYVKIDEVAANLYKKFLPGPLTVVSRSRGKAIRILEVGRGTLGIRVPDYPWVLKLIKRFGRPITSTSANTSGKKTPYCLSDILKYTSKKKLALVDLVLDAGKLPFHSPSTVVDTTLNQPIVLRQGEIRVRETLENTFHSGSEQETKEIAHKILQKYLSFLNRKPLIFALQGELGSGKTQFAKGLALALNLRENIVSPTFTIIREYPYKLGRMSGMFYHLDTWRLERGEELLELGLGKMLKPKNVVVIEWLQKIKPILERFKKMKKAQLIWVNITTEDLSKNRRRIAYQS